ncbi:MAG: transcriptional repressor LexA [Bradymonadales bacterium]|jgi:repressor LexA
MEMSLTQRQAEIYLHILAYIDENMYPPSVREITNHFGLRSTNGVAQHLAALVRKGYLSKEDSKSRTLRPIVDAADVVIQRSNSKVKKAKPAVDSPKAKAFQISQDEVINLNKNTLSQLSDDGFYRSIPVLGRIAAGPLTQAYEEREESLIMDASLFCRGMDDVFALRVRGTSMIGDGIMPGDIVFIREQSTAENGELIAALVGGEATVKRYERRGKRIRLLPSNPDMEPIDLSEEECEQFRVLGSVRGVLRQYA